MKNRINKNHMTAIIALLVIITAAFYYYRFSVVEGAPGENNYRLANKYLEEGKKNEALDLFNEILTSHTEYKEAYLGKALALMQLEQFEESMTMFDKAISIDENFATAYANRGILNDKSQKYAAALNDYRKAIELNPDLTKGPGWIWRFLRNITEKPPTIADRADYIEEELKKPESERLLSVPEMDSQQRMYKK